MDRLDELRLLLAIVDAGSLAGAARRLGRSPPAVTRILADLERRVGTRLIQRTTRRMAPTESGRRLAEHARRLLADYEEALSEAGGAHAPPRGRLRVAAPIVFGQRHVAPVVTAFLDAFSEVSVELSLADRIVDLIEEGVDVAVRIAALEGSSLVARRIGQVRRILVASPAYLARRGVPDHPHALAAHDIVLLANPPGGGEWLFSMPDGTLGAVRVSARFQVDRAEAAIAAAREGRGVLALLSYQVATELAAGTLVRLLQPFEPPPIPVQLVFASARLIAPRLRAFLDFAAPRLSALGELRMP